MQNYFLTTGPTVDDVLEGTGAAEDGLLYEEDFQYETPGQFPRYPVLGIQKVNYIWKHVPKHRNMFLKVRCMYRLKVGYILYDGFQNIPWNLEGLRDWSQYRPETYIWACVRSQIILFTPDTNDGRRMMHKITIYPRIVYLDHDTGDMVPTTYPIEIYMRHTDLYVANPPENYQRFNPVETEQEQTMENIRFSIFLGNLHYAIIYFMSHFSNVEENKDYNRTLCNLFITSCQVILLETYNVDISQPSIWTNEQAYPPKMYWMWYERYDPHNMARFQGYDLQQNDPNLPGSVARALTFAHKEGYGISEVIKAFYGPDDFCDEEEEPYPDPPEWVQNAPAMAPSGLPIRPALVLHPEFEEDREPIPDWLQEPVLMKEAEPYFDPDLL